MAKKTNSKASTVLDMLERLKQDEVREDIRETKELWKNFTKKIKNSDIYKKLGKPKFPKIDALIEEEFEVSRVTKNRIQVIVHLFSEEISFTYVNREAPKKLSVLLTLNREEGTAPRHDPNKIVIPHSNP